MSKSKGQEALEKLCQEKGVKIGDVEQIFDLYGSDKTEEQIEIEVAKYPKECISIAAKAFLGVRQ